MTTIELVTDIDLDNFFPITTKAMKMFGNKIVYVYSVCNLFVYIGNVVGLSYYGLFCSLNKQFWLEFGILNISFFSMILQLTVNLLYYNLWQQWKIIYASQLSWNSNNSKLKNEINRICKRVEISFICCCCMVTSSAVAAIVDVAPHLLSFMQNIQFIATIERHMPFLPPILFTSFLISTLYMALLLTMALYYPYYFFELTRIQLVILRSSIESFQENMPPAADNNFHCYVKEGLRKIVKQHHKIWRLYCELNKEQVPIRFLINASMLLCIIFNTTLLYSPYYSLIAPAMNYTTTVIAVFYFSSQGQVFEDLVAHMSDILNNLNWYDWNEENKKSFRTFLGVNKPARLHGSMSPMIHVNNGYFKQSMKMAYSLVNLARTISHK